MASSLKYIIGINEVIAFSGWYNYQLVIITDKSPNQEQCIPCMPQQTLDPCILQYIYSSGESVSVTAKQIITTENS